jgi:hypothetical protein
VTPTAAPRRTENDMSDDERDDEAEREKWDAENAPERFEDD